MAWRGNGVAAILTPFFSGEMSERLKERDWKSRKRVTVSRVRIPFSPLCGQLRTGGSLHNESPDFIFGLAYVLHTLGLRAWRGCFS